jgi:hypothetical protein
MMELKTVALRSDGAFSVLLWDTRPFAVTVERTFDDMSTVLHGITYRCRRDFYNRGGYATFQIIVPGHDRVLFHKGNKEVDSMACVCVAESFTQMDGVTAISDSKHGFEEFMSLTSGLDEFDLIVTGRHE